MKLYRTDKWGPRRWYLVGASGALGVSLVDNTIYSLTGQHADYRIERGELIEVEATHNVDEAMRALIRMLVGGEHEDR